MGQSETDGCSDGLVLGAELVDGNCEESEVGCLDTEGTWLGMELGCDEGWLLGEVVIDGLIVWLGA